MTPDALSALCDVGEGVNGPAYFVNGERVGQDTYLKVARLQDEIEQLRVVNERLEANLETANDSLREHLGWDYR